MARAKKKPEKDPRGGLTAAGRKHFAKTEGAHLKPGVKTVADTPEKMKRKGSFLRRHFANPRGPMVDEKGRPTRLALSAHAWGEAVPKTMAAAKKLADKGSQLLERYRKVKDAMSSTKSKKPATKRTATARPAAKKRTPSSATKAKTSAKKKSPAASKKSATTKKTVTASPRKKSAARKTSASKRTASAKSNARKTSSKKSAPKSKAVKRRPGEKNSLVANINARKRAGASRPKSRSTVSKKSYGKMEKDWS